MINADGDFGLRGKGTAAEKGSASQAVLVGRDDNIGATVTVSAVVSYSDNTLKVLLCLPRFVPRFFHLKNKKYNK